MTNEQFWNQISPMIKNDGANQMLPFFISQGVAAGLSIPVVVSTRDEVVCLPYRDMVFAYCCTGAKPKDAPKDARVKAMPLDKLLSDLKDGEFDGIGFLL